MTPLPDQSATERWRVRVGSRDGMVASYILGPYGSRAAADYALRSLRAAHSSIARFGEYEIQHSTNGIDWNAARATLDENNERTADHG